MTIIRRSTPRQTGSQSHGMVLILFSTAAFSLMSLLVRVGSTKFRPDTLVFVRCTLQALCMVPWLGTFFPRRGFLLENLRIHFVRGTVGIFSMWMLFTALRYLPLVLVSLLSMTSILWAAILGRLYLGERQGIQRILLAGVVCLGFVIVLWPESGPSWGVPWQGVAAGLACGVSTGIAQVLIRQMGKTRSTPEIVFWFGVVGALYTAPSFFSSPQVSLHGLDVLLVLSMGITATLGQVLLTSGFRWTPAMVGSLCVFCGALWNLLLGYVFLAEVPPAHFWMGAGVVVLGIALLARDSRKRVSKI